MDNSSEPLDFSLLPDVSDLHPETDDPVEQMLADSSAHMEARKNALVYIFGKSHPEEGLWAPRTDHVLFFNWPGGAVMCFPPQGNRTKWYYVTHGLAQPPMEEDDPIPPALDDYLDWLEVNDKAPVSGWGIELVISTRDFCDWPFEVLLEIVEYLLFKDSQIILSGHRLPLANPIVSSTNHLLNYFLAVTSPEYPSTIRLPGGLCSLIHLVGVTEAEVERARRIKGQRGSLVLQSVLQKLGVGCLTDPERLCVTTHPQFEQAWREGEHEIKEVKSD